MALPQESLRIFAPAKINWVLTIRGKRPDGYHDLDTIFQAVNWGDELICRPLSRMACTIFCGAPGVPLGKENLIHKAWRLMADRYESRVAGLSVELTKRLPMGAGLGGGSSDAVAALFAINRLYRLRLSADKLEQLAAELGSDCPFFVRGGTALGEGRGEILTPIKHHLPPVWLVIVWPGFGSSTAEAYGRSCPEFYETGKRAQRITKYLKKGDLQAIKKLQYNVFSLLVSEMDVRYKQIQEALSEELLSHANLSGSGSAMFAYASDRKHAQAAEQRLLKHFPAAKAVTLSARGVRFLPEITPS